MCLQRREAFMARSCRRATSAARAELELALATQIRIGPDDIPELLKTWRRLAEIAYLR